MKTKSIALSSFLTTPRPHQTSMSHRTQTSDQVRSGAATVSDVSVSNPVMQVTRHDHHNIEIKSVIELCDDSQKVVTEMFLFVPKSFEIGLVGKAEFAKDLRTRLRLSTPSREGFGDEDYKAALQEIKNATARLDQEIQANRAMDQDISADLRAEVLEAAKDAAAILAERLKFLSREHGRQFFLSQTLLLNTESRALGFETFIKNLQMVRRNIEMMRESIRSKTEDGRELNALLDEYVSQLYVQYLGAISTEFENFESSSEWNSPVPASGQDLALEETLLEPRTKARQLLRTHQEDEAGYRRTRNMSFENETDLERERHLSRLSQLKKFFQSKTFVDVTKTQAAQRVTESTALVGTAIAAIIAATLEQLGRKNVATLASHGLMVVGLGVILYVLRDRMKEWARSKLAKKAMGLIPDFETRLIADQKNFGISREWLHILQSKNMENEVTEARHADSVIDRDLRLPEDVLSTRRVFFLRPNFAGPAHTRALHENVRLNLDRHLKFMDDPFKDLTDLEADGRLTLSRSRRVYHFHMVTRTSLLRGPLAQPSKIRTWVQALRAIVGLKPMVITPDSSHIAAHRIVLDKSGIVRVESVS